MSPQTIAHYRIVAKIGEGGMGEVYRATDTKLGRDVAIKILPEAFAHDGERMARFAREAQVLASLNHPNIAAIYGVEDRALVMELVEGPTLAERIKAGLIPLDEALPVALQIAEALEYAHERGIVHRDLKPANIKLTPEGKVKVLDFGLAKALTNDVPAPSPESSPTLTMRATLAGVILGTAAYMSPEQAKGKSVDRRADIWAFGVVLMEMLTGRHMYTGETVSETLAAVIMKEPDISGLPARTPSALRQLLRRCLNRDPHRRLRDIGEARVAIEETLAGGPQPEAQPIASSRRTLLPRALAAFALLITAVLGMMLWRAPRPVEQPFLSLSVDMGPNAIAARDSTFALSPDGKRMVFLVQTPNGKNALAVRPLGESKTTMLSGTENATDPFFSPDGQWLAYFADGKLRKTSVRGGANVELCDAPFGRGGSWGPEGTIIAALDITTGLYRIPEAGGRPQLLTKPEEKGELTHRWPQILPDGRTVLFTAHNVVAEFDEANIEVLSLQTGRQKIVQRGGSYGRYLPTGHLVYVHHGTLFGVAFDPGRLEGKGTPVPLLEEIAADVNYGGGQFDFSQNGTFVYLTGKVSGGPAPLLWMDRAGQTRPLIANPGHYLSPRFSPDGKHLAVVVGGIAKADIWIHDLQRETTSKLTVAGERNFYPVWAPDGKHLAYQSGAQRSILWIRADGAGEPQLLWESKQVLVPYSFSPDGRLAFAELGAGAGFDLWTLRLDLTDPDRPKPGKAEPFLITPVSENYPAFSPDGRWIAYVSNESGMIEVYVRPFAAGSPRAPSGPGGKWPISNGGGIFPRWSTVDRQLFYESPDGHVMVADYTVEGDSFRPSKPRRWTDKQFLPSRMFSQFDLEPSGKRVAIMLRVAEADKPQGNLHATMLVNWFDEVRRRLPPGGK